MRIELLSIDEYNSLLAIQKANPKLTYENKGYEGIDESDLSENDKESKRIVETILRKHIKGFTKFQNFREKSRKDGELEIRFQYNYNYDNNENPFYGVGYITLKELLNGFE